MKKIAAKLVVLFVLSLFFICNGLSTKAQNITTNKKQKKISIIITSVKLRKAHNSSFNYSMIVGYKNTGTATIYGQYLKREVKIRQNNQWIYLNGGNTAGMTLKPGIPATISVPINIKCTQKTVLTRATKASPEYRDFMVNFIYKGKTIAYKILYRQNVCKHQKKIGVKVQNAPNLPKLRKKYKLK